MLKFPGHRRASLPVWITSLKLRLQSCGGFEPENPDCRTLVPERLEHRSSKVPPTTRHEIRGNSRGRRVNETNPDHWMVVLLSSAIDFRPVGRLPKRCGQGTFR